jgi:hypothetical protein
MTAQNVNPTVSRDSTHKVVCRSGQKYSVEAERRSIVVTFRPPILRIGATHERLAVPLLWRVKALHNALP